MAQDELLGDIRTVLAATAGIDPADVTQEKSFDDLGIDSMTMVEAVVSLEDHFGVLVPDDTWSRFSTVGDLVAHLQRLGIGAPA